MKLITTALSLSVSVALPLVLAQDSAAPKEPSSAPQVASFSKVLEGGAGGLAVDAKGFVYCADFGSKLGGGSSGGTKIYKMDPKTGEAKVFVEGLRGASGNAFAPGGDLYQSNIGGGFITKVKADGTSSVFLRNKLVNPVGIAIDEEGVLFVANCGSGEVLEVLPGGEASVFAKSPLLACPNGITLDEEHNLYISNFNNGDVLKISWAGEVTKLTTLPGKNNGHIEYHEGFLYVVARGAHQIYRVDLEGKVELFAGSGKRGHDNGPALEATFSFPNDIAFSPDGQTMYVNENASTTEVHTELAPMLVRKIVLAAAEVSEDEREGE